jgi:hypothetical protein
MDHTVAWLAALLVFSRAADDTWCSAGMMYLGVKLQVVELGGSRVLIVGVDDEVYAVSNKCSHLGLPIVGESARL